MSDGLPALSMMNEAPRASRPFARSSGSVRSMIGVSGPAEPTPPGSPSHIDTFDPTMNFGSLISFATRS